MAAKAGRVYEIRTMMDTRQVRQLRQSSVHKRNMLIYEKWGRGKVECSLTHLPGHDHVDLLKVARKPGKGKSNSFYTVFSG